MADYSFWVASSGVESKSISATEGDTISFYARGTDPPTSVIVQSSTPGVPSKALFDRTEIPVPPTGSDPQVVRYGGTGRATFFVELPPTTKAPEGTPTKGSINVGSGGLGHGTHR